MSPTPNGKSTEQKTITMKAAKHGGGCQLISTSVLTIVYTGKGPQDSSSPILEGCKAGPSLSSKPPSLYLINCLSLPWCDLHGREGVSQGNQNGGQSGKEGGKKGEFRRAMRRGLTTLLKIKGWSAEMLPDLKTLIYCHC